LVEFEVEGIPDGDKARVTEEVVSRIQESGLASFIAKVVIASDLGAAIERIQGQAGAELYNPVHDYGRAIAKTMHAVRDGQISFSIVFDARLFSTSKDEGFLDRQYFIFHELGHVRNGVLRFRNLPEPGPGPAGNKAELQRENAWRIWEEYYSERSAAETIARVCQAVSPGIEVGFAATLDHADQVLTFLDGFGTFVRDQVRSFRYRQIDTTELTSSVTNKIRAVVTLLAYVFALEGLNQRISEKVAQIEKDPSYQTFFQNGWQAIVVALRAWYQDKDAFRRDLLERAAEGYGGILLSAGLELTDRPQGYYVQVRDV
jgi:hypothetical protein